MVMHFLNKINTIHYFYLFSNVIFNSEAMARHHGSSSYGKKAQEMCEKYTQEACKGYSTRRQSTQPLVNSSHQSESRSLHHSHSTSHIVGGTQAKSKQYPHMALIFIELPDRLMMLCGGSLISHRFVMTAAHCDTDDNLIVRLGDLNYQSTADDALVVDLRVTKKFIHPNYRQRLLTSDILLLQFRPLSSFTEYYRPICLNVFENIPNRNLIAVGWGHTVDGGSGSPDLRSVQVEEIDSKKCDSYNNMDEKIQLCAGSNGKTTCQGDSGGPLIYQRNPSRCSRVPIYSQVGIVSSGYCGAPYYVTFFTRVSAFIPWIETIVWN